MYCEKCGVEIQERVKFCPNCGERLMGANQYENVKKQETKRNIGKIAVIMMLVSVIFVVVLVGGKKFFIKNREDNVQGNKVSITQKDKNEIEKNIDKIIKEYNCIRTNETAVLANESGITMNKKYDKNGNVIYQLDGLGDDYYTEYKYTYFESGEISSENWIHHSYGEIASEFKATYKENGEIISGITITYVDGVKTEKIHTEEYEYTYNNNGDVEKKKVIIYLDGIKTGEEVFYYAYDKNGEWKQNEYYRYSYENNELVYKGYRKWSEQKQQWNLGYSWLNSVYIDEVYKEYNEYDDVIKESSSLGGIVDTYKYVYDEHGNILNKTETTYFDVNDIHKVTEWSYKYEFDEDGNILSKYAYEGEITNPEDWSYYCTWTYYE